MKTKVSTALVLAATTVSFHTDRGDVLPIEITNVRTSSEDCLSEDDLAAIASAREDRHHGRTVSDDEVRGHRKV